MKYILIGLAVLLVAVLAVGFLLPTSYAIEQSITIQAAPEKVHAYVGDLKKWEAWAPWVEDDPTIETTYGEKTTGVGASQSWTSESGDGELKLTRSDPKTGIAYEMAFIMEGTRAPADCAMAYEVSGETTTVKWTMDGDVGDFMPPVVAGYMNLLMKGQIAGMFDRGLEKLKALVEAQG